MAEGKLNVFNLGDVGVRLTESPVHTSDGALVSAQNAQISQSQGEHAIRKRPGLDKLTASAMSGSVLAMTNIPIPDPFPSVGTTGTRLYASQQESTSKHVTTDGTTWTSASSPGEAFAGLNGFPYHSVYPRGGTVSLNGTLYFLDGNAGRLHTWDGTTDTTLSGPLSDVVSGLARHIFEHQGAIYAVVSFGSNGVLAHHTGSAWEISGTLASHRFYCGCSALNRIYLGTELDEVYYWTAADGFVKEDITGTDNTQPSTQIEIYNSALYLARGRNGQDADLVFKRGSDGTWTDITAGSAKTGYWGPLAVFNGLLFAGRQADAQTPNSFTGAQVWTYDGSTWTQDLDLTSVQADATVIHALLTWNGALYLTMAGSGTPSTARVMRRTTGGSWSTVVSDTTDSPGFPNGPMGFY